jgi:hypothetical protein
MPVARLVQALVAGTLLVVGNPNLGAELALPWSEREARMIGQREKDATVLVRADATESQVPHPYAWAAFGLSGLPR